MKILTGDNWLIKLGQNKIENWDLLDSSNDYDYFFHLSSFPSGYVILEYDGVPSNELLQQASVLCRDGTKYKNLKKLKVDYCTCSNLEKGDSVGHVVYKKKKKVNQFKLD